MKNPFRLVKLEPVVDNIKYTQQFFNPGRNFESRVSGCVSGGLDRFEPWQDLGSLLDKIDPLHDRQYAIAHRLGLGLLEFALSE